MLEFCEKIVSDYTRLGWKCDPLGIVQEISNLAIQVNNKCTTPNLKMRYAGF